MRLLGSVLIVLAAILLVLFFWVVTDPVIQPPSPLVMLGMPTMILGLYVVGFLARFIGRHPADARGKNTLLPLPDLLRQSIYGRLAGSGDVNDAERLSQDPAFRLIGSSKIWERGAALTSRLQSFGTELLTENLAGLAALNRGLREFPADRNREF